MAKKPKQSVEVSFKTIKEKFLGQQPVEHPKTEASLQELSELLEDKEDYRW